MRHSLGNQSLLGNRELENAHWLTGPENPADGPTKVKSDTVPLLLSLQSGSLCPGALRPLRGVTFKEKGNGRRTYIFIVVALFCLFRSGNHLA